MTTRRGERPWRATSATTPATPNTTSWHGTTITTTIATTITTTIAETAASEAGGPTMGKLVLRNEQLLLKLSSDIPFAHFVSSI